MGKDDPIDELYTLPLEEFTERRNSLAKELKDKGNKDEAARVKKLTKPTLPAWAVNQLARSERDSIAELIEMQHRLATTGSAQELRELTQSRRRLVTHLTRRAEQLLADSGHGAGAATVQAISQTLLAGATEDEQGQLLEGRLTRELSSSGLEQVWGLAPAEDDAEEEEEEVAGSSASRKEAEDLTRKAAAAQQSASRLGAEVERLRSALEEAEAKVDTARKEAKRLEDAAAQARRAAGIGG